MIKYKNESKLNTLLHKPKKSKTNIKQTNWVDDKKQNELFGFIINKLCTLLFICAFYPKINKNVVFI